MNTYWRILSALRYLPIYLLCIAPAALLWERPLLLTLIYALASVGLLAWRRSPADRIYYFVPFVFGPAGEYFAVRFGAWDYALTDTLPIWLPFAWGIAGLFMKSFSEAVAAGSAAAVDHDSGMETQLGVGLGQGGP